MRRNWRRKRNEQNVRRFVTSTDNEEWNALVELLNDTRTSLRAFLELLNKHDDTLRVFTRRTKKLSRAFCRNYPSDHLDPRVIARARQQALAATPPSPPPGALGTVRCEPSLMVARLVGEYVAELDVFAHAKFHKVETLYSIVCSRRAANKQVTGDVGKTKATEQALENKNSLEVAVTAYNLALQHDMGPLRELLDKRFVAYKAIRVAYWSAQLEGLDAVRVTLRRSLGTTCGAEVSELDEVYVRMRDTVNTFVNRLDNVSIKKMTPEEVDRYKPTEVLDDACEHSFHTVLEAHDPREREPRGGIFRRFQSRNMTPRNQSMPPTSRHSPISIDESDARASLPSELRGGFSDDVVTVPIMSPVSSLDGRVGEEPQEQTRRTSSHPRSAPRKRGSVSVQWLKRRFESSSNVAAGEPAETQDEAEAIAAVVAEN